VSSSKYPNIAKNALKSGFNQLGVVVSIWGNPKVLAQFLKGNAATNLWP
jgi:hypothetical protein